MDKRNLSILFLVAAMSIQIIGCDKIKQNDATDNTKESIGQNEKVVVEELSEPLIKERLAALILDYKITTGVLSITWRGNEYSSVDEFLNVFINYNISVE